METVNNETLCVVNITRPVCVNSFCTEENKADKLANTLNGHNADLLMYQDYAKKYEYKADDGGNYWEQRYESEKDYKYDIISLGDFKSLQRKYYLDPPLAETTEERWYEMLEVLPPMKWKTIDGVEMFLMSEFENGNFTRQFARAGDKYYEKVVDAFDVNTWIHKILNNKDK